MSDTIEQIALRFTSGNGVPVDRAYITAEEWKELRRDADRMDWLESQCGGSLCSDDDGRWAVSDAGFGPVPDEGGFTEDVALTSFVEPEQWKPSIRAAIDSARGVER